MQFKKYSVKLATIEKIVYLKRIHFKIAYLKPAYFIFLAKWW